MGKAFAVIISLVFIGLCVSLIVATRSDPPTAGPQPAATADAAAPSAPADAFTIVLATSNAKKAWIDAAITAFEATGPKAGGKAFRIKALHVNSGDSWNDIRDGRLKPELWSPGDDSWFRVANDHWRGQTNADLFPDTKPLVQVPLCIAMWQPMAEALGWPKPIGWNDLLALAENPQGWGAYGHPEWGPFTWGHAHPDANSGFLTVVSACYAFAGKNAGLTVEDLRNDAVAGKLKRLEHSVKHYGLSSVWIDDLMRAKGPSYLSAAVQYENAIIAGNRTSGGKPFPLVAVYPKEGMVIARHPIAVPQAEWITAEERDAAAQFIAYLAGPQGQRLALEKGMRPADGVVGDAFKPGEGALAELPAVPIFEVPDNRILARVKDLWLASKKPASVTLIIDVSGSMRGEPMDQAKVGAQAFLDAMYAGDEVEIIAFSSRITPVAEMASVGAIREQAKSRVAGLFADGGTRLHDVAATAIDRIKARRAQNPGRHYGIVLLTDGKDDGSSMSKPDLMDKLPKGDDPDAIRIFTIAYGTELDKSFLRELATRSNGRMFESNAKDIVRVYQELSANF